MKKEVLEKVFKKIDQKMDEVLYLQKNLISIPAISPENGGKGEFKKANFLIAYFKKKGIKVSTFNAPDPDAENGIRPNLVVTINGENPERFCVISHLDVVPEGDEASWHSNPFKMKIDGKNIIGRGSEDNHQGIVSSIIAALSIIDEGIVPSKSIMLSFVSDEETGSKYGIKYLIEKGLFKKDDMILVPDAGSKDGSIIEIAEKTILWIKFEVIGKQCHASRPGNGINAARAGAELIVSLDKLTNFFPEKNNLFNPPESTFSVTRREENVPNINTIPGKDIFYMDLRILPEYNAKEIMNKINEIAKEIEEKRNVSINISIIHKEESAGITNPDSKIVKTLSKAITYVNNTNPKLIGIGGGTVANILRREKIDAVIYSRIDENAHSANEYAVIDNIINDAKVMAYCFIID